MNMLERIIRFFLKRQRSLGGQGFYPIPPMVRAILNRYSFHRRLALYARLCKDVDLSFLASNEVGCAESVSRCLRELDESIIPVTLGTYTLWQRMKKSNRFVQIPVPYTGCVVVAATGTGNGSMRGHTGIYDGRRIWNNNSYTGRWTDSYTIESFRNRYEAKGGMKVRFFIPKER